MMIYGDAQAALSTDSDRVHQRIYLFIRLKEAKASAKQRQALRVNASPEVKDLN